MNHIRPAKSFFGSMALALAGAGCSRNPTLEISGSFFPAWMLSLLIGIALALVFRRIFISKNLDQYLRPALLVYGCLALSFTILAWLILYF